MADTTITVRPICAIADMYGYDDAKSIVLYFLANASTFRGPQARALKLELKALVK